MRLSSVFFKGLRYRNQLGGKASFLSINDLHLGRGEPLEDTAKVISSMADAVVLRTQSHDTLTLFAKHSSVPVINGLTDLFHQNL